MFLHIEGRHRPGPECSCFQAGVYSSQDQCCYQAFSRLLTLEILFRGHLLDGMGLILQNVLQQVSLEALLEEKKVSNNLQRLGMSNSKTIVSCLLLKALASYLHCDLSCLVIALSRKQIAETVLLTVCPLPITEIFLSTLPLKGGHTLCCSLKGPSIPSITV